MQIETSLSKLSGPEWQQVIGGWMMFGSAHYVSRVGRKWMVADRISSGFPLFATKAEADQVVRGLVMAESRRRAHLAALPSAA